jgi:hypothetical protein
MTVKGELQRVWNDMVVGYLRCSICLEVSEENHKNLLVQTTSGPRFELDTSEILSWPAGTWPAYPARAQQLASELGILPAITNYPTN